MKYEPMKNCASVMGTAPYRTFVGSAWCEDCSEPYIVIWNEHGGIRAFLPAAFVDMAVHEAFQAKVRGSSGVQWMTETADEPHIHHAALVPA